MDKFLSFRFFLALPVCLMFFAYPGATQNTQNHSMKEITVPKISVTDHPQIESINQVLEQQVPLHTIDEINWTDFPYKPKVQFRIGHVGQEIWLTFYVTEKHVLARKTQTNSSTHLDSCVEFFIDPQQNGHYYNFEFNAIGTTHLAYGQNVREREFLDPAVIESEVRTYSSLGTDPLDMKNGEISWELTVVIPASILTHDDIRDLEGKVMNANFFKCGDETVTPHFLSWNRIDTDRPSFHQPAFFGRLTFE